VPNLRRIMRRGAVAAAVASGGMLLSGGTDAGVMQMIGRALPSGEQRTVRLLGVSPAALVTRPGGPPVTDPNASALETHHTNFVLVPGCTDWGGETSTMFAFAAVLAARVPAVAVLANGGMISKKEVLSAVRHGITTVVIEGSGRLADQIARALHRKDEAVGAGAWDPAAAIPDAEVREVVESGCVRLFSVTGHGDSLRALLVELLAAARARLPRQRPAAGGASGPAGAGGKPGAAPASAAPGRSGASTGPDGSGAASTLQAQGLARRAAGITGTGATSK